jgi:hypothetical protein
MAAIAAEEKLDWTNAQHAHGPRLADWLEPYNTGVKFHGSEAEAISHTLNAWRRFRRCVAFEDADRIITAVGLVASLAPDEVWVEGVSSRGRPKLPADDSYVSSHKPRSTVRDRALEKLAARGPMSLSELADAVGATTPHLRDVLRAMEGREVEVVGDRAHGIKNHPVRVTVWGLVSKGEAA